ncbi:glycosyl hydrolase family7 [Chrysochromulina tobinii]|uniref:cellulose 1,4-beta-cellobiosidase (non-reducing end) n=1 Tax=Chrysochromulina tobinii TaxID=1460289 RepID=A0A0M0K7F1_9EUKA|nr:glycosyl hydrolase family7 [Chrysochromulina tobinii]|eukprot:KOO34745.1 glycosyl hydrolase family7 [Chrysochromulina sp. CCMP291]
MFHLKNREFSFDVDMSKMPCGLNGALYFVQMDQDGGKAKYSGNEGGAKYGTGYCDAQCPHDLKFINGEPNLLDWHPSATDPNAGTGKYGTCCVEMDIWEANSVSTAYTAHACDVTSQTRCDGISCGDNPDHRFDGHCDKNGCDFQTFRLGNETFYGPGGQFVLDTTQPMTVVTQFFTADGTDHGKLVEMRRFYRQGSKTIQTPSIVVGGAPHDSLTTPYCTAERDLFKDGTNFLQKGGLNSMDDAYDKGMVLVMSIWDDHDVNMLWLDSIYPPTGGPGSRRGTCSNTSGVPSEIEKTAASSHVTFSNIRFGPIGSTGATTVTHAAKPLLVELAANASAPWAQCTSASGCTTGWECTQHSTDFSFKQCTPSTALHKAFLATRPDAAALKAFMDKGTTHFAASGLPA